MAPEPVYTPAPEPVYTPAPEPVYTPAPEPVYTPPPAPTAPPPLPPVEAASGGASGWLVGLLGAAAVAGGILLASSGDDAPTSP